MTQTRLLQNLPFPRNPFFTGREDVLTYLHSTLMQSQTVVLTQAISGLGGIGKTQTALEYAYRYQHDYTALLWANASSREALITSFLSVAALLDLPNRDKQDVNQVIHAVMRWLKEQTKWLLVLDNADNLPIVSDFLPTASRGHIVLTTRTQAVGTLAYNIKMENMQSEVGALFLLRRANIISLDASLEHAKQDDQVIAKELSQTFDGLPLALDQAGAYIKETGCSLAEYVHLYQDQQARLLRERGELGTSDYPASVATTWSLSLEQVMNAQPAAVDLLRLCAFLAPDAIPEEIITNDAANLGPLLQSVVADPFEFNSMLRELLRFSLLRRNPDERTLTIHRLVQAVLRSEMTRDTELIWIERDIHSVNHILPASADMASRSELRRYLAQLQFLAYTIEQWEIKSEEAVDLLKAALAYTHLTDDFLSATHFADKALEIKPDDVWLYVWRGMTYKYLCSYQRALQDMNQALTLDPQNAWAHVHRGLVYMEMKDYPQALQDMSQALALNPQNAWIYVQRGSIYMEMKDYSQALQDMNRALTLDPQSAWAHVHRGLVYKEMKDYQQALQDMNRALTLDPQSEWVHVHRGLVYKEMKDYQQALQDLDRAVELEPPNSWIRIHRATTYRSNEEYQRALQDLDHALESNPREVRAYIERAITYGSLKEYQRSLQDLDHACVLAPENARAYAEKGIIHLHMGNTQQARMAFGLSWELVSQQKTLWSEAVTRDYLTPRQVAELYHVTESIVYRWIKKGWIEADRVYGKNAKVARYHISPLVLGEMDKPREILIEESKRHWMRLYIKLDMERRK